VWESIARCAEGATDSRETLRPEDHTGEASLKRRNA